MTAAAADDATRTYVVDIGRTRVATIMTGAPWRENCHVLIDRDSNEAAIIDPGAHSDAILDVVLQQGVTVRHVLLTHGHHDHVGAVAPICRTLGLACRIHSADTRLARQAPLWAFRFAGKKIDTPAPLEPLNLLPLPLGGQEIRVVETPGHTAGGVCFMLDGLAITGDTLLVEHIGRTDLPGANQAHLLQSVTALLELLPGNTTLFAGHGRAWTAADASTWWATAKDAPPSLVAHRDLS